MLENEPEVSFVFPTPASSWDRFGVGLGREGKAGMHQSPGLPRFLPGGHFRKSPRNSRPLRPENGLDGLHRQFKLEASDGEAPC